MIKEKKATILIYVLFLVTLSLIFATIILNNATLLSDSAKYFDVEDKLFENIRYDGNVTINILKQINSNGSGFIDNISCPNSITMSGTTLSGTIVSELYNSGNLMYCSGTYQNSGDLKIYFNSGFTDLTEADYAGFITSISSGSGDFLDPDNTHIDFSSSSYLSGDLIDDNFDSDDYKGTSTGVINYPNNYQDDDNLIRKMLFGYVPVEAGFKKIFWNTTKITKVIDENLNNTGSLNIKLGATGTGFLHLNIDNSYELKLVKFDKTKYYGTNELILLESLTGSNDTGNIGYLTNTGSLSSSTGSAYNFDFINNDYAIFLKSTGSGTLLYEIKGETDLGTGIYINPIDDSLNGVIRYFGNEILINEKGRFLSKESEILYKK